MFITIVMHMIFYLPYTVYHLLTNYTGLGAVSYYLRQGRTKEENSENDFRGYPNSADPNFFEIYVSEALDNTVVSSYILKLRTSVSFCILLWSHEIFNCMTVISVKTIIKAAIFFHIQASY